MNVSEFWETVVSRDILAYTVPGSMTLVGVALLATGLGLEKWGALVDAIVPTNSLLFAGAFVVLSYVTGHIQTWVYVLLVDRGIRRWSVGQMAVELLDRHPSGGEYEAAALWMLGEGEAREDASGEELGAGKAAYLMRLCDHYVLNAAPRMHSMYIGRYSVFFVFFRNLGISTVLLGLCALTLLTPSGQEAIAQSLEGTSHQIQSVEILTGVVVVVAVGVMFIFRAGHFERMHVQGTFEVFYLVRLREKSLLHRAQESRPETAPGAAPSGEE